VILQPSAASKKLQELCWRLQEHGLLKSPEAIAAYERVDRGDFVTGSVNGKLYFVGRLLSGTPKEGSEKREFAMIFWI
jgi:protein-L-isoaspartate O-methyltransferase